MRPVTLSTIALLCITAVPRQATSQSSDATITFNVPLDLTQVSSDIAKVAVYCYIDSNALPPSSGNSSGGIVRKQEEVAVTKGQVVTTVTVVFSIVGLNNPVGQPASYECSLTGYSTSLQRWDVFDEKSPIPAFRLAPTPVSLKGNFVW